MSNEMTIMENGGYMAAAIDLRDLLQQHTVMPRHTSPMWCRMVRA